MLKKLPPDETAYQVGLDDIRGILRELEFTAGGITWITLHWLIWIGIFFYLPMLLGIVKNW